MSNHMHAFVDPDPKTPHHISLANRIIAKARIRASLLLEPENFDGLDLLSSSETFEQITADTSRIKVPEYFLSRLAGDPKKVGTMIFAAAHLLEPLTSTHSAALKYVGAKHSDVPGKLDYQEPDQSSGTSIVIDSLAGQLLAKGVVHLVVSTAEATIGDESARVLEIQRIQGASKIPSIATFLKNNLASVIDAGIITHQGNSLTALEGIRFCLAN